MMSGAKQSLLLPALLLSMLIISACENDLNKIKEISAKESEKPEQKTTGVDIMYSDSAFVRLRLVTPLLVDYSDTAKNAVPYRVTPKGVNITFYDTTRRQIGSIVADSSIQYPRTSIMEFHRNVVAKSSDGAIFKSEELIWDQAKKIIYSNTPVQVTDVDGEVLYGNSFMSDERLTHYTFGQGSGTGYLTETP